MLIKIWKSDVLTKTLEDKLYSALERSLSEVHSDFVQQILDKSPMGDVGPTKTVLLKFFDSLLDLSINERTVHYLATSDVPIDGIYERFEELLSSTQSKFIKKLMETGYKKKHF